MFGCKPKKNYILYIIFRMHYIRKKIFLTKKIIINNLILNNNF